MGDQEMLRAMAPRSPRLLYLLVAIPLAFLTIGLCDPVFASGMQNATGWFKDMEWSLWLRVAIGIPALLTLFLSPGIYLSACFGKKKSVDDIIIVGFIHSLVLVSLLGQCAGALNLPVSHGAGFLGMISGLTLATAFLYRLRSKAGKAVEIDGPSGFSSIVVTRFLPVLILLVLLVPKLFWESFDGDGIHVFEVVRMGIQQPLPFWTSNCGPISSYPGLNVVLSVFPMAWFMRVLGEHEAAIRLPFLLFLILVHSAIGKIASMGKDVSTATSLGIWGSLFSITAVLAFSVTYNPYHADLGGSVVPDCLFVAMILYFFAIRERGHPIFSIAVAALCLTTSPGAKTALACYVAVKLVTDKDRRMPRFVGNVVILGCAFACFAAVQIVINYFDLMYVGDEHSVGNLLRRFRFLYFMGFERFLWILVPGGVHLVLSFFWPSKSSATSRALGLWCVANFALYFFMLRTALHYYIPAMFILTALFWCRWQEEEVWRSRVKWLPIPATLLTIWLCLPAQPKIATIGAQIGSRFDVPALTGYEHSDPEFFEKIGNIGPAFFPTDGHGTVPHDEYGVSHYIWNYYARKIDRMGEPTYLVTTQANENAKVLAKSTVTPPIFALVNDETQRAKDQAPDKASCLGPSIFRVDRRMLLGSKAARSLPGVVDVSKLRDLIWSR